MADGFLAFNENHGACYPMELGLVFCIALINK